MRTMVIRATIILVGLWLVSCAAGPNEQLGFVNLDGVLAGFWRGLWHGLILPVTFVVSLFTDNTSIYEVHNNGGWYDLGFLLGAMTSVGGGCGNAACRLPRRK